MTGNSLLTVLGSYHGILDYILIQSENDDFKWCSILTTARVLCDAMLGYARCTTPTQP